MAGLLCKDWLLLRRQLWYYALLLGLYLALTAAGVLDASFLCGLAVLYGTLLPTTCFSYDEAVHWERYAAATPAGRRGTVDGKYLLALLLAALSGGISLFLTALMEGPESALSLAVQYYASPYIVANVPPNCFIPRPNVGSAVIRLTRYQEPPVHVKDTALMFRLIRASFNQRRKTLQNGLNNSPELSFSKEEIAAVIEGLGLPAAVRGEALTLEQFAALANAFSDLKGK